MLTEWTPKSDLEAFDILCGFQGAILIAELEIYGSAYLIKSIMLISGPVAQLVRAPPCHGGGREFESHLGRSEESKFLYLFDEEVFMEYAAERQGLL